MNATKSSGQTGVAGHKTDLAVTQVLAHLLQRLDQSAVPVGAEQYRSVVTHLVDEIRDASPDAGLGALLDAYPAAAEVYENLNYQHAGLCRSGLEVASSAELEARTEIERIRRKASGESR